MIVVVLAGCADEAAPGGAASPAPAESPPVDPVVCPASAAPLPAADRRIASAGAHACAWRGAGPIDCWGSNEYRQLGDGTTSDRSTPGAVLDLASVRQVVTGTRHTCALLADATVSCWGEDAEASLGDDAFSGPPRSSPKPVAGLRDVATLASAGRHTCARTSPNDEVWCWGMGRDCQLGNGGCSSSGSPVRAVGVDGAVQIVAGYTFSCALRADGSVWCWGSNGYGECGSGDELSVLVPERVVDLDDVVAISSGTFHVCAQRRDGQVLCWGENQSGSLGIGANAKAKAVRRPAPVLGLSCSAMKLAPGGSCVLLFDGGVACWGEPGASGAKRLAAIDDAAFVTSAGAADHYVVRRDGSVAHVQRGKVVETLF